MRFAFQQYFKVRAAFSPTNTTSCQETYFSSQNSKLNLNIIKCEWRFFYNICSIKIANLRKCKDILLDKLFGMKILIRKTHELYIGYVHPGKWTESFSINLHHFHEQQKIGLLQGEKATPVNLTKLSKMYFICLIRDITVAFVCFVFILHNNEYQHLGQL